MYHSFLIHSSADGHLGHPCPGYYKQCCDEHWGTRMKQVNWFIGTHFVISGTEVYNNKMGQQTFMTILGLTCKELKFLKWPLYTSATLRYPQIRIS